jgi:hypothetical protein
MVTEFETVGDRVQGRLQAQAWRRPSCEGEDPCIKLRDGAEPVRMSARKHAPPQLKFIRDKLRELEELGLVYKNTGAEWASPPLILPKPGPDQYRMTVDLRVPKESTKPSAWPMPNLQDELHDLHGSEVFATLDFVNGIADTSAKRFSRLSIFHHAGWSVVLPPGPM